MRHTSSADTAGSTTTASAPSTSRSEDVSQSPLSNRSTSTHLPQEYLVSPPVALAGDVFARIVAEVGRADDEELEALRPGLVTSPRSGRDAHRVPLLQLDDLVVDFHPPAAAHDDVHLLLRHVCVAVRKAIAGRDTLIAQGGLLELERLGRRAELQVRHAVEPRADVLQILLDVAERERHGVGFQSNREKAQGGCRVSSER